MSAFFGAFAGAVSRPIASGDFTNIITINGSPAAFSDVFDISNPNGAFDQETNLDAGGLKCVDGNLVALALNSTLVATLLASGFTILVNVYATTTPADIGGTTFFCDIFDDPAYSVYSECNVGVGGNTLQGIDAIQHNDSSALPVNQESWIAITFTAGHLALSFNGGAVLSIDTAIIDGTTDGVLFGFGGGNICRLRSFAFVAPVDDADLPTLSAP